MPAVVLREDPPDVGVETGRVIHLLHVAELVDDDAVDDLGRASMRRQLKLRLPLALQLPHRLFWRRMVIRPGVTPMRGAK